MAEAGQSLSVNYSGSGTGANEYVSAMLADKSGNILCYGRIAHYNPRGTASLDIPSDLEPGSYTLKLFSEQYNGDKMTDYASDFYGYRAYGGEKRSRSNLTLFPAQDTTLICP